jgi:hypothetical protein
MERKELEKNIGAEMAVDRTGSGSLVRARIIEVGVTRVVSYATRKRTSDGVKVEWLDDGGPPDRYGSVRKGDVAVVRSRRVVMPWAEHLDRLAARKERMEANPRIREHNARVIEVGERVRALNIGGTGLVVHGSGHAVDQLTFTLDEANHLAAIIEGLQGQSGK